MGLDNYLKSCCVNCSFNYFFSKEIWTRNRKAEFRKTKIYRKKHQLKLDSIINKLKSDKDIRIIKVDYTADSTLKIFFGFRKSETIAAGFDNLYQIMDLGYSDISSISVEQLRRPLHFFLQ
jgi:hypothetical protein